MIFKFNQVYSRKEIKQMMGLSKKIIDGNFNYYSFGMPKFIDTFYIFANIGISGKTGHDYDDRFINENQFYWTGPNDSHINQKRIKELLSINFKKLLFVRYNKHDDFTFAGKLSVSSVDELSSPIRVVYDLDREDSISDYSSFKNSEKAKNDEVMRNNIKNAINLWDEARFAEDQPIKSFTQVSVYIRNPHVSLLTKKRANGYCELCNDSSPFLSRSGEPYLETHHIVQLSDNGVDKLYNCVALCPNCHKELHYGELSEVKQKAVTEMLYRALLDSQDANADDLLDFENYHSNFKEVLKNDKSS